MRTADLDAITDAIVALGKVRSALLSDDRNLSFTTLIIAIERAKKVIERHNEQLTKAGQ
jgi:hypothetical protein